MVNVFSVICAVSCQHQNNLSKHNRAVHKQIRYGCDLCDYKSTTRGNVKTHANAVHEKFKYFCQFCEFQSGYKTHLKKHQKFHHESDAEVVEGNSFLEHEAKL